MFLKLSLVPLASCMSPIPSCRYVPSTDRFRSSAPTATRIVFTAYSITSTALISGTCIVQSGTPFLLPSPFTIYQPTGINSASFLLYAESAFISALRGLPTCSPGGISQVTISQIATITPLSTTLGTGPANASTSPILSSTANITGSLPTSLSSTLPTTPPNPVITSLGTKTQIGIGVGVPVGTISFALLGLYIWRRKRGKDHRDPAQEIDSREKAEIEARRAEHELPATSRIPEMDTDGERLELPVEERTQELLLGSPRQELSGGELAQEIGVPLDAVDYGEGHVPKP